MIFSKKSHDGYLFVDHRASPGLPEDVARAAGYDPVQCREGKTFEAPTLGCVHCGAHVVLNPLRTRDRAWCMTCDAYICDLCNAARATPGYVHINFDQLHDLLCTRKWTLTGTMSNPCLVSKS